MTMHIEDYNDRSRNSSMMAGGEQGGSGNQDEKRRTGSSQNNPGNFANDPERAAEAGRKGGLARGQNQSDSSES